MINLKGLPVKGGPAAISMEVSATGPGRRHPTRQAKTESETRIWRPTQPVNGGSAPETHPLREEPRSRRNSHRESGPAAGRKGPHPMKSKTMSKSPLHHPHARLGALRPFRRQPRQPSLPPKLRPLGRGGEQAPPFRAGEVTSKGPGGGDMEKVKTGGDRKPESHHPHPTGVSQKKQKAGST